MRLQKSNKGENENDAKVIPPGSFRRPEEVDFTVLNAQTVLLFDLSMLNMSFFSSFSLVDAGFVTKICTPITYDSRPEKVDFLHVVFPSSKSIAL